MKENNHYLLTHHYTDSWKTNLDIHVQEGKRAITTKTVRVIQEREAGLDMLGTNVKHGTAASHSAKGLNIPFVLQKGRTVNLHHEQKRYIGQDLWCMTGDSHNVRRNCARSFYIHSQKEAKGRMKQEGKSHIPAKKSHPHQWL